MTLFSFQDIITCLSGIMIFLVLMLALDVVSRKERGEPSTSRSDADIPRDRSSELVRLAAQVKSLEDRLCELSVIRETTRVDAVAVARDLIDAESSAREWATRVAEMRERIPTLRKDMGELKRSAAEQASRTNALRRQIAELQEALSRAIEDRRVFFIPEEGVAKTPLLVQCSGSEIRAGFITRKERVRVFPSSVSGQVDFAKFAAARTRSTEFFVFMVKPSGAKTAMPLVEVVRAAGFDAGYDALEEDRDIGFLEPP